MYSLARKAVFRYLLCKYIVTCMSDYRRGFGLDTGFIEHFNIELVIIFNYSTIHTLKIIITHTSVLSLLTRRFLVTASNNGYFSASGPKFSLKGGSLPTAYSCSGCPPYILLARITVANLVSNSTSIVERGLFAIVA
jgi:hypothetical protein